VKVNSRVKREVVSEKGDNSRAAVSNRAGNSRVPGNNRAVDNSRGSVKVE
jgi:hypothetical protein